MKRIGSVICLCLFLMLSVSPACAEPFFSVSVRKTENAMTADRIEQERQEQWEAYQEQMRK